MAEKTRYSDAELEEFRAIILEKLEIAKRDYELLRSGVTNSDGNDSYIHGAGGRRFYVIEGRGGPFGATPDEIHPEFTGRFDPYRE